MKLREAYAANYDQIAADWIAHWRATGKNPFQHPNAVLAHENETVNLVTRYAPIDAKILDAGCAMGDLMLRLSDYRVVGCDISSALLDIARERGLSVTRCFVENMPFGSESFDMVVTTDVLEHVLDLNAALTEMLRVLKPGGLLIMRVPNEEDLNQYLAPSVPYRFIHLRRFDQASTRLLLTRVFELEIVEMTVVNIVLDVVARK